MSREYVLQSFRPAVHLQINYAAELNEQQHAAVTAPPGPALVIAGAGSGKTRALTYRVAFLLEQGAPPESILLLTFTNKAAREMMGRVAGLVGGEVGGLWGGTFHSIGHRVLRRHARVLGLGPDFTILDRDDSRELIQSCLAGLRPEEKPARFPKADVLADIFSLAINRDEPVEATVAGQFGHFTEAAPLIASLGARYQERKRSANALDFDDLLALWLKALREREDLREETQRRFQFILVDEYQDTNRIQGELVDLIAGRHRNVMAVGDDSQSIYSWRGAHFENILKFTERYPGAAVYRIETNYRSSPEILQVANAAIAANVRQFAKRLVPARPPGAKPAVVACLDGRQQAAFVAQRVLELREGGAALQRMAVLYRSHFHALELQLELTRRQIPFAITSGIRFFEQAHIKDVAAYLRLVTNPRDELAFKRIVRLLEGVGPKMADKLWRAFSAETGGVRPEPSKAPLATALQKINAAAPKRAAAPWAQLTATVSQLEAEDIRRSASRMIQLVMDAGYEDHLREQYPNYLSRCEDLQQLGAFARQFPTVEEFLAQLALQTSPEAAAEAGAAPAEGEQLLLSTIHQAKGLEFDVVFVISLCDGLFPSARSLETSEGEEEERRLFYVAVTRARDELYLTYPLLRAANGGYLDQPQLASRFLGEIPKDLVEEWNLKPYGAFGGGI